MLTENYPSGNTSHYLWTNFIQSQGIILTNRIEKIRGSGYFRSIESENIN